MALPWIALQAYSPALPKSPHSPFPHTTVQTGESTALTRGNGASSGGPGPHGEAHQRNAKANQDLWTLSHVAINQLDDVLGETG